MTDTRGNVADAKLQLCRPGTSKGAPSCGNTTRCADLHCPPLGTPLTAAPTSGGAFSWGSNIYSQLGRPRKLETKQLEPRVRRPATIARNLPALTRSAFIQWVTGLKDDQVVQMSSSNRCTMAVTSTGQVGAHHHAIHVLIPHILSTFPTAACGMG